MLLVSKAINPLFFQPTGRAIQVEGGGGERRPSADIRRQRTRDSDAVIQVRLL